MNDILKVENLNVLLNKKKNNKHILQGLSFNLEKGSVLGIVGESGCGKTTLGLALMGLLDKNLQVLGKVYLNNSELDLEDTKFKIWKTIRGKDIALVFQDSLDSLNPMVKVGKQLTEAILIKTNAKKTQAKERAMELLDLVEIPSPEKRFDQYPHELSGGMRQRIMIAIALANDPKVLICDEPTTALDVTIQNQILAVLKKAQSKLGMSIIFISHDIGIINEISNEMIVMYAGKIVERGPTKEVLENPAHPYTSALLEAMPELNGVKTLKSIPGAPPELDQEFTYCPFGSRCDYHREQCDLSMPDLFEVKSVSGDRQSACYFPLVNIKKVASDSST